MTYHSPTWWWTTVAQGSWMLVGGVVCQDAGLNYCGKIKFRVTHIFREENACADKLVNL